MTSTTTWSGEDNTISERCAVGRVAGAKSTVLRKAFMLSGPLCNNNTDVDAGGGRAYARGI